MPSKKKAAKDVAPAAAQARPPEPAPKPAATPAAKPAAKATAKPAAKPAAKPVATPEAKPTAKPATKPAVAPEPKQESKPKPKAASKATAKPSARAAEGAKSGSPAPAPKAGKPGAPKTAAVKGEAKPVPPTKASALRRASFAALDDVSGPDDDDLEDDDGERGPKAAVVEVEEPAEAPPPPPRRLTPRVVPPLPPRKAGVITVAVSPDADDAYMLYALAHGKIDTEARRYEIVRGEIAQLNEEAGKGTYDVSAFSFGAWATISERYFMLATGASLGDGVGPVVVSKTVVRPNEVNGLVVGVPGANTTAALVLRLWLHPARLQLVPLPFDAVVGAVKEGKVRAGVLIHEAQLTYRLDGLTKVVDLGRWWTDRTDGLPLPLGGMVVRRDIPAEERAKISLDLKRSIAYAMGHRDEALTYAAQFSKGLPRPLLERYIANYVNELTLDLGERGKQAVQALFDAALRLGLVREPLELELAP